MLFLQDNKSAINQWVSYTVLCRNKNRILKKIIKYWLRKKFDLCMPPN